MRNSVVIHGCMVAIRYSERMLHGAQRDGGMGGSEERIRSGDGRPCFVRPKARQALLPCMKNSGQVAPGSKQDAGTSKHDRP